MRTNAVLTALGYSMVNRPNVVAIRGRAQNILIPLRAELFRRMDEVCDYRCPCWKIKAYKPTVEIKRDLLQAPHSQNDFCPQSRRTHGTRLIVADLTAAAVGPPPGGLERDLLIELNAIFLRELSRDLCLFDDVIAERLCIHWRHNEPDIGQSAAHIVLPEHARECQLQNADDGRGGLGGCREGRPNSQPPWVRQPLSWSQRRVGREAFGRGDSERDQCSLYAASTRSGLGTSN